MSSKLYLFFNDSEVKVFMRKPKPKDTWKLGEIGDPKQASEIVKIARTNPKNIINIPGVKLVNT